MNLHDWLTLGAWIITLTLAVLMIRTEVRARAKVFNAEHDQEERLLAAKGRNAQRTELEREQRRERARATMAAMSKATRAARYFNGTPAARIEVTQETFDDLRSLTDDTSALVPQFEPASARAFNIPVVIVEPFRVVGARELELRNLLYGPTALRSAEQAEVDEALFEKLFTGHRHPHVPPTYLRPERTDDPMRPLGEPTPDDVRDGRTF